MARGGHGSGGGGKSGGGSPRGGKGGVDFIPPRPGGNKPSITRNPSGPGRGNLLPKSGAEFFYVKEII